MRWMVLLAGVGCSGVGDTEPADTDPADTDPADTDPTDTDPVDTDDTDAPPPPLAKATSSSSISRGPTKARWTGPTPSGGRAKATNRQSFWR